MYKLIYNYAITPPILIFNDDVYIDFIDQYGYLDKK